MSWQKQKGSSNRYINSETGETISRRQYDRTYGVLQKQGFTSYEQREKSEIRETKQFKLSKTAWNNFNLGGNFNLNNLRRRVTYVYTRQIPNFSLYYGMSLFVRINGINFGTPIIDVYDLQSLFDELKRIAKMYGINEDDEDELKDIAIFTFHQDMDI